ncbi:HAD family phosphatase [bacterium]|nr:HAD family phosphatase [bacterium]
MKGVAFDLEGTCVDLEEIHFTAYSQAFAEQGIIMSPLEIARLPNAMGGGARFIFQAMLSKFPDFQLEIARERKRIHFVELFNATTLAPRPGLIEFIESQLSHGCTIAIGSTTSRDFGTDILIKTGLDRFFPPAVCVFREDVSEIKPAGEVFARTAHILHVVGNDQLVFEDSVVGIQAAHQAGSSVIAIPAPFALDEDRISLLQEAGPVALFEDWEAVPRLFHPAQHNDSTGT